jgi:hypothetical protein
MRFLILMILCLAFACAAEDEVQRVDAGEAPTDDAGHDAGEDAGVIITEGCAAGFSPCDIRDADCQAAIAAIVACYRESDASMPEVRVLDEAEYEAELAMQLSGGDVLARLRIERWLRGLGTLGLAPATSTPDERADETARLIGAQYSHQAKHITVVDRGGAMDDMDTVALLAHEMVHAQQDEARDLTTWYEQYATDEDVYLAASSVVEGEATLYSMMLAMALYGRDVDSLDWSEVFATYQEEAYASADADRYPYLTARSRFFYAFGGGYVAKAWVADGRDGIDALFDAPPRSIHAVLFGASDAQQAAADTLRAIALPTPSPDYAPVNYTPLGAFLVRAFLVRAGLDAEAALAATEEVGADVMSVLVQPMEDSIVGVWRWQLVEGASGDWFDQLEMEGVTLWRDGSTLTIAAGPAERVLELQTAEWMPLPP